MVFGSAINNVAGGGLTKLGLGVITWSAANTYNGNTTVSVGTLKLTTANASNESSSVTIASSGATFELGFAGTDTVDKPLHRSHPNACRDRWSYRLRGDNHR